MFLRLCTRAPRMPRTGEPGEEGGTEGKLGFGRTFLTSIRCESHVASRKVKALPDEPADLVRRAEARLAMAAHERSLRDLGVGNYAAADAGGGGSALF